MSQPLENQPLEKVEPKVVGGRNPPVEPNPQIKIISAHSIFNENAIVLSQKFKWKLETDLTHNQMTFISCMDHTNLLTNC